MFCRQYSVDPPRLLPSDAVDAINEVGCSAWGIEYPDSLRFVGQIYKNAGKDSSGGITVRTSRRCKDVCLLSDLPIVAGLYDTRGKVGVYYEIYINKMDGIIAVGKW